MFDNHKKFITERLINKIKHFDANKTIISIYFLDKICFLIVDISSKSFLCDENNFLIIDHVKKKSKFK
jgi:hypothetical protein